MSKKLKFLVIGFLTLALVVGVGVYSANAALTLDALTITSSGALTLEGAAASVITVGALNTGGIAIGNGATIKTISIGAGDAVNTIKIGDHATPANVITIGGAASNLVLTDAQWGVTGLGAATFVTVNGNTITTGTGTLTLAAGSSLITSGAFAATLTSTATTNATLPAGTNTLYSTLANSITSAQLLSSVSDETGTGLVVFATSPTLTTPVLGVATGTSLALGGGTALTTTNQTGTGSLVLATSPTLVTPVLGVATATSINGNIFTTGSSTYTGTAGQTYTFPTTSATIARTDAANTFTGNQTFSAYTIKSVNAALTATAGGAQAGTALTKDINFVTTVATIGDSVQLPVAVVGMDITIINRAANSLNVFGQTGDGINAGGANVAYAVATLVEARCIAVATSGATAWECQKSVR